MTSLCTDQLRDSAPARPLFRNRVRPLQALRETVALWRTRNEGRKKLRNMPEYLLRDIGLSTEDVIEETRKPFWTP